MAEISQPDISFDLLDEDIDISLVGDEEESFQLPPDETETNEDVLKEIMEDLKRKAEDEPAGAGVPLTTPKKSPSPRRAGLASRFEPAFPDATSPGIMDTSLDFGLSPPPGSPGFMSPPPGSPGIMGLSPSQMMTTTPAGYQSYIEGLAAESPALALSPTQMDEYMSKFPKGMASPELVSPPRRYKPMSPYAVSCL